MPKSPEFYKGREAHTKKAREKLPLGKQLEYPVEDSKKKVGVPPQELIRMRSSQDIEDQLFIQTVFLELKKRLGKDISKEEIQKLAELEQSTEEQKEKFIQTLEIILLYQKGMQDSDFYVREATAGTLGALAEHNPKLAQELYQKGMQDSYSYVREATAGTLWALAEHNPKLYQDLYQKGMQDSDISVRRATAGTLGALAEHNPKSELFEYIQDLLINKYKVDDTALVFALMRVRHLVQTNQDLSEAILSDLPTLQSIREYFKELNSSLPQDQQLDNVDEFIKQRQFEISQLFNINKEIAQNFLSSIANQFGFHKLASTLELLNSVTPQIQKALSEILSKTTYADYGFLEKLLQLQNAYTRMGFSQELNDCLDKILQKNNPNKEDIIILLGRTLFTKLAKELEISQENLMDENINLWNLEYLPNLFAAQKGFEDESKDALNLIIKTTLQGDFERIILGKEFDTSKYDEDELYLIEKIQEYNKRVRSIFQQEGVDFGLWLSYPKHQGFQVGTSEEQKTQMLSSFQREVVEVVLNIMGSQKQGIDGILSQDRVKDLYKAVFKKYGLKIEDQELSLPKEKKLSPMDLKPIFEDLIKFLEQELKNTPNPDLETALSHLRNLKDSVLPQLQKETKRKGYKLEIRQWDRNPGYDIFQGNYTHCCIAVEASNRGAILDYLADTGMNIIEIKDKSTDTTIAQTYVFLAQNPQGEIFLILDNVEINNDYRGISQEIRQHLFEYIEQFAGSIIKDKSRKINTVLLGTAYNDIETGDLNQQQENLFKLGGSGVTGTEYLDAFGSSWVDASRSTVRRLHVVLDDLRERQVPEAVPTQEPKKLEVHSISSPDNELMQAILEVENSSFDDELKQSERELKEAFNSGNGINLYIQDGQGNILGYISSQPHNSEVSETRQWDPDFSKQDNALYIESIAIKQQDRSIRTFLQLIKEFIRQAKQKGYTKLTSHTRVQGGLSHILQDRYGAKSLRRLDDWLGGEPFEYLEIEI